MLLIVRCDLNPSSTIQCDFSGGLYHNWDEKVFRGVILLSKGLLSVQFGIVSWCVGSYHPFIGLLPDGVHLFCVSTVHSTLCLRHIVT